MVTITYSCKSCRRCNRCLERSRRYPRKDYIKEGRKYATSTTNIA